MPFGWFKKKGGKPAFDSSVLIASLHKDITKFKRYDPVAMRRIARTIEQIVSSDPEIKDVAGIVLKYHATRLVEEGPSVSELILRYFKKLFDSYQTGSKEKKQAADILKEIGTKVTTSLDTKAKSDLGDSLYPVVKAADDYLVTIEEEDKLY